MSIGHLDHVLIVYSLMEHVTWKSTITDHAVEENHVIDWDKAKVVNREAQQQTRWIREALGSGRHRCA